MSDKEPQKKQFRPLTDRDCRNLKYTDRPPRCFDGQGLYIEARKTKKAWMFKSKLKDGKAILMTLGEYPAVTLAEARQKRQELRELIAKGLDPRQVAKQREQAEKVKQETTLEKVTAGWLEVRERLIDPETLKGIKRMFERHVFPTLGNIPVTDITAPDVLNLLLNIEKKSTSLSHRIKGNLSRVFSHAIQMGIAEHNPPAEIVTRDVLKPYKVEHHKTIELGELPGLMRALEADAGAMQVKSAVYLMIMLFMRKGELIKAEWSHIDLKSRLWTVPADNTKKRREQVYPLPRQAINILENLQIFTGACKYVFSTGKRNKDAPLGEATINNILTRCGYHGKMTVHGFRALAASWMDEQGYNRQVIERQLSHLEKGQTNQAYHRADYMEERREMLQAWADYIDSLKEQDAQQTDDKAA